MNEVLAVSLFVAVLIVGLILWMKLASRGPKPVPQPDLPVEPMTLAQIDSIETALNVKLPQACRDFLGRERQEANRTT